MFCAQVAVDLGNREGGVPEQALKREQTAAAHQKVAGEGVAQHMPWGRWDCELGPAVQSANVWSLGLGYAGCRWTDDFDRRTAPLPS